MLLCISVCVCVCACACVYQIFLNQSSVDGHLGCFHILAILSIDAIIFGKINLGFWNAPEDLGLAS